MEHRHLPNSLRTLTDQGHDINRTPNPYIHTGNAVASGNGSFVYPVDNMLRGGVHCASRQNSERIVNDYPSSNFGMDVPHLQPVFPSPSYGPFPHSSAAGNLYLASQDNARHAQNNYYGRRNIYDNEPHSVTRRGSLKRKSPEISVTCERGNAGRFYGAGSSSSSSELPLERPTPDHQNITSGHIAIPHNRGGSLSIADEYPSRNVRSRSRLDLECSYSSHRYHSSNYHETMNLTNMNADRSTRQWNFNMMPAVHGRIQSSGSSGLSQESNQLLVRGSGTENGGYHFHSVSSTDSILSSQHLHAPPICGATGSLGGHSQRAIPSYGTGLGYSRLGHEAASAEDVLPSPSGTYSSRYSRSFSEGWRGNHRNVRSRIAIDRFQSIASIGDAPDRVGSEDLVMMGHSTLFASSRNLFDQYGDMRLDIDNMSYEELLALGERIGNVNTGLSEDVISKCLTQTMYSSPQKIQTHGEETCAICLEEYANEDVLGTIKTCGHNHHASCIRQWLLMKNACPICKTPALKDPSKGD